MLRTKCRNFYLGIVHCFHKKFVINVFNQAILLKRTVMDRDLSQQRVRWCAPDHSFVKLNVDGAHDNNGISGCGGILRDHHGGWLGGFSKNIGICSVFMAEAWGLYIGVKHAIELGFKKVVIETDSRKVVDSIR